MHNRYLWYTHLMTKKILLCAFSSCLAKPFKVLAVAVVMLCAFSQVFADFTDIQYSWYRGSILSLQSQWLTDGYGDGSYGTENNITRAELLTLLLRASKVTLPEVWTEKCFPDVDSKMWYHKYVCAAQQLWIASGFQDGKFKPNNPVTTLEAIAFGNKAFALNVSTTSNGGTPWYDALQKFANDNNILATHSYTIGNTISRWKSADLIIRLMEFQKTHSPLSYQSTGCGASSTITAWENTITIAGKERKYNLSIPSGYSNSRQYSLIIATHGRTNSKDQVQKYMGLDKGQTDSIVAYPAALSAASGKSFSWSEKENMTFVDAILRQVSENYCINRDKVYAVGHSLGGWMAQRIACQRGEFISGLAVVGSGAFGSTCTGPVPTLFFQNTNDQLSSYASGKSAEKTRLTVNACNENLTQQVQIGTLTCTEHMSCTTGNKVVWCEGYTGYGGDPHSWPTPNGGKDILEFLRK